MFISKFCLLVCVSLVVLSFQSVQAQEGVSTTIHHHYISPRALGMGDAFVAVANDYSGLFYNPAGLARREDGELNLYIDGGISSSFFKMAEDISAASKKGTTEVYNVLQSSYGNNYGGRISPLNGILVRPNWGIGVILADITSENTLQQNVGPAVNTTLIMDSTVAFGYADDLKGNYFGRLSWGITGKFVNRGYFSKSINFLEIANDPNAVSSNDLTEGYTVDADLGLLYTPDLPMEGFWAYLKMARPSFGMVLRNALETGFGQSLKLINKNATGKPEKMYRVIDLGTKWEYPSLWIFSGRGVLDIRDIMHPAFNFKKALHLGFEFDWTVTSWWKGQYRVGWGQGYLSAGLSAMFTVFNLDLVTYGEDVGTYYAPIENRVYALRANLNF